MVNLVTYENIQSDVGVSEYNKKLNQRLLKHHNTALLPVMDYLNMIVPQKNTKNTEKSNHFRYIFIDLRRFFLLGEPGYIHLQVDFPFEKGEE